MIAERPRGLWFEPDSEERQIIGALREFLQAEVAPTAAERDESGAFPFAIVRKLGQMGVMGAQVPEEYGGAGLSTRIFAPDCGGNRGGRRLAGPHRGLAQ